MNVTGNSPGDSAIYSCDPDYDLVGESVRICGNNGMWSGEAPICRRKPSHNYINGVVHMWVIILYIRSGCMYRMMFSQLLSDTVAIFLANGKQMVVKVLTNIFE